MSLCACVSARVYLVLYPSSSVPLVKYQQLPSPLSFSSSLSLIPSYSLYFRHRRNCCECNRLFDLSILIQTDWKITSFSDFDQLLGPTPCSMKINSYRFKKCSCLVDISPSFKLRTHTNSNAYALTSTLPHAHTLSLSLSFNDFK